VNDRKISSLRTLLPLYSISSKFVIIGIDMKIRAKFRENIHYF